MRSVLIALALAAACASAPSSDPLNAFRYRPERVPKPGTVVQYVKSNLDGSKPSLVSLYFADHDDVEVSRSEAGTDESADVKAHLDWKRFIADRDGGTAFERERDLNVRVRVQWRTLPRHRGNDVG